MVITALEGIVENGMIRLTEKASLVDNTKVYVIVADVPVVAPASAHVSSPRLADPQQAKDFRKEVLEVPANAQL